MKRHLYFSVGLIYINGLIYGAHIMSKTYKDFREFLESDNERFEKEYYNHKACWLNEKKPTVLEAIVEFEQMAIALIEAYGQVKH
jgi:hypothetical protein